MTILALLILALVFRSSICNKNVRLSTYSKTQIACAQLRASNCSDFVRWDLHCAQLGLTGTGTPKALRPGYRSFKAGKVKLNIKKHTTRLTRDAALRVCKSEGGSLLKIDTEEKEVIIKQNIKIERRLGKPAYLWLGLRYFRETNRFLWTDNTPLVYENWGSGEPSHMYRKFDGRVVREDCVALAGHLFLGTYWNDLSCRRKYGFICEVQ